MKVLKWHSRNSLLSYMYWLINIERLNIQKSLKINNFYLYQVNCVKSSLSTQNGLKLEYNRILAQLFWRPLKLASQNVYSAPWLNLVTELIQLLSSKTLAASHYAFLSILVCSWYIISLSPSTVPINKNTWTRTCGNPPMLFSSLPLYQAYTRADLGPVPMPTLLPLCTSIALWVWVYSVSQCSTKVFGPAPIRPSSTLEISVHQSRLRWSELPTIHCCMWQFKYKNRNGVTNKLLCFSIWFW